MLFLAAAILYSTVHALGVTGAAAVPAHSGSDAPSASVSSTIHLVSDITRLDTPVSVGRSAADSAPVLSAPVEGHPDTTTLAACGAVHGEAESTASADDVRAAECLAQLASAGSKTLSRFAASLDPDDSRGLDLATALGERGSAAATTAWWADLPEARRTDLTTLLPSVVGNLEGVPYSARDTANRLTLHTTIDRLDGSADGHTSAAVGVDKDARRLVMLQQVELALDRGREGDDAPRSLLSLDTVFPGKAAVAVGDVDTADNVSVMVPGMLYTVSNQITWWTDRAADLHSEQDFWSSTLATDATAKASTNATIAWMGYRTPDVTNVLGLALAKVGAVHLEDAVEGLQASRTGAEPRITIMAHSYGSTTATMALTSGKIRVDSFVVLGSPGSVVTRADKLAVTRGSVYAAAAALDPVAGSGVFGADPGSTLFGATLLNIGGGTDPYTEQHLSAVLTHNRYFTPGSQSMRNLALIGIGQGDLAGGRAPSPNEPKPIDSPSLAFVRPQDVNREALNA